MFILLFSLADMKVMFQKICNELNPPNLSPLQESLLIETWLMLIILCLVA